MINNSFFYISNFNWLHILVILTMPVFIVACTYVLKDKSEEVKDRVLWTFLWLIVAAYALTFITDCITKPDQRTYILARLPLQLCGINVFLFPIVFRLRKIKNQKLYSWMISYIYFVGSPAALLGVLMPPADCINMSLLTYNCTTYFFKHCMLFCFPILLATVGYYKPKFNDMFKSALTLIMLMSFMYLVNKLFMAIGGYEVNYFYSISAKGNPALEFFWNLIPIEWVYMLPMILVVIPIFALYYVPFGIKNILEKSKEKLLI